MALTPSTMPELGTKASSFKLQDTNGEWIDSKSILGNSAVLVMFICNHCPYVKHIRKELGIVTKNLMDKGLQVVAINSNDAENYPEDSPEKMKVEKKDSGWHFSYLFDDTQEVAKAYRAACTPDFFLYDKQGKLVYRGQFDSSRPGNGVPVTGEDLIKACEAVLQNKEISPVQKPSVGCNIKWK